MQFFLDECISPQVAERINAGGQHVAVHPRDIGRCGDIDHVVLRNAITEDRIIVTENARDFRGLVGKEESHPGLIILPCMAREQSMQSLRLAIAFLEPEAAQAGAAPSDDMVNRVIEVDTSGQCRIYALPDTRGTVAPSQHPSDCFATADVEGRET